MLTSLDDVEVVDLGGLVTRPIAERRVTDTVLAWLVDRLDQSEAPADLLRVARVPEAWVSLPEGMSKHLPPLTVVRTGDVFTQWFGSLPAGPSPERRADRWAALVQRYPSQPELRWHQARSLARAGARQPAVAVLERAAERWPDDLRFADAGSIDFVDGTVPVHFLGDRGFVMYSNGRLRSRPLAAHELASLEMVVDVDDPGPDGGRFEVVSDCGRRLEGLVPAPARFELVGLACQGAPPITIDVSFLNDAAGDGFDRNLYVRLTPVSASEEPARR